MSGSSTFLIAFELAPSDTPEAAPTSGWVPAIVPGGVHESLIAAGIIEHPYYAQNEVAARWVEDRFWWYRSSFELPAAAVGERLRLVFHGLDSVASVWIDDQLAAEHESMHYPCELDLTGLAAGTHELLLRFAPPLLDVVPPQDILDTRGKLREAMKAIAGAGAPAGDAGDTSRDREAAATDPRSTRRRKAIFGWGWDFAPRLPAVGVWQPVELVREQVATVEGFHARATAVDVAASTATLAVDVGIDNFTAAADLSLTVDVVSPAGVTVTAAVPAVDQAGSVSFEIADAQLWWTHDLGDQPLYDVTVTLRDAAGAALHSRTEKIGLRTVTLDTSPDPVEGGRLFRFILNGVPTYSRGANWIPASMMYGSVSEQQTASLIAAARHGEMTMIRVWGGGIYPTDDFFDACDREGILIWQDFMFACTDYPSEDPALQEQVRAEAEYQVQRLRNHASLGLWCGNNEVHAIHALIFGGYAPGNWGYDFFHRILPAAVTALQPGAIYWPGSPFSEEPGIGNVNNVSDGDRHDWEVWHGIDVGAGGGPYETRGEAVHFHRYANDMGRFISEFGLHSSPDVNTLERWTPPGSLSYGSEAFLHRNKDTPKDKGNALMERETGIPGDLAEYVAFSMACQAEGLKFGVEHFRRRQPHNSGTLVWQFNDPWPGISWSLVDYDAVPKAAYWFLKRSYAPVLASFKVTEAGAVELWVSNSSRETVRLSLKIEIPLFEGGLVTSEVVEVVSEADSSVAVWTGAADLVGPDRFAWVSEREGRIESNRAFFSFLKNLPLNTGHVTARVGEVVDGSVTVELTSSGYAYFVAVTSPVTGLLLDRNYVDLRDGETVTITVSRLPESFDATSLQISSWAGPATILEPELVR